MNTNDKITKFFDLREGEVTNFTKFNAESLGKIMNRDFGDKSDLVEVNTLEEFEKFEWFARLKEILRNDCNINPTTLQSFKFYFSYNSYGGGFREEHRYIGIPKVFMLYFEVSDSW